MAEKKIQSKITVTASSQGRRLSIAETDPNADLKDLIVNMNKNINDKQDSRNNKIEQHLKIIIDLQGQVKDLTIKNKELDKTVEELKIKTRRSVQTDSG